MPIKTKSFLIYSCLSLALWQPSHALIFPSGDNEKNKTAPDSERTDIFNAIGRSSNGGGGSGSVVYLGGKYVLTANHVNLLSKITFDGITYFTIDTAFTPRQVGDKDLKIIKLEEAPTGLVGVTLNTSTQERLKTGTIVGWGRGRDTSDIDGSDGWDWDSSTATEAKRWGTNQISATTTYPLSYQDSKGNTYTNTPVLVTTLSSTRGDDEVAAAYLDSGGGIFAKFGNQWRLVGLTILASDPSDFNSTAQNYFLRISTYASAIEAEIPDLTTLSGWKVDHSLYDADADNSADTDSDGIGQLLEFALGGDPNVNDISILPTHALVEDGGNTYLELTVTRPNDLQGISYTPITTTDLTNWPNDSTGILDASPTPTDNGDGTETLIYRRSQAVSDAEQAFIRIEVSEI